MSGSSSPTLRTSASGFEVCGSGTRPQFERKANGGAWTVARQHFGAVADALAERYGLRYDFLQPAGAHDLYVVDEHGRVTLAAG